VRRVRWRRVWGRSAGRAGGPVFGRGTGFPSARSVWVSLFGCGWPPWGGFSVGGWRAGERVERSGLRPGSGVPIRTARAALVARCGWSRWGGFAVGGCGAGAGRSLAGAEVPTRTARAVFVVGCRWPQWGGFAVGGCAVAGAFGRGRNFDPHGPCRSGRRVRVVPVGWVRCQRAWGGPAFGRGGGSDPRDPCGFRCRVRVGPIRRRWPWPAGFGGPVVSRCGFGAGPGGFGGEPVAP
jgi:hypothetical protein